MQEGRKLNPTLVNPACLLYNRPMRLEQRVASLLLEKRKTISVAESCSGGLLSHRLTNIAGSSNYFKGAVVAYSNAVKLQVLKVPPITIRKYGAVSEQVALCMAQGIRSLLKTDFGIAVTGIAGPSGAGKNKPVGLTFIAINTAAETICLKCLFKGKRIQIKSQAATFALKILAEFLT